jgi:glycosyltransferase involved in cell wall biosynthesis
LTTTLRLLGIDMRGYAVALRGRTDSAIARWRVPARAAQTLWRRFGRPTIAGLTRNADVVHATNFVLPPTGGAPGVVTVHDLSFERSDTFPGGERLRDLVPWSTRRAGRVLVPTAAIGNEVVEHLGVDPDRIAVTHEGVAPVFFGATPLGDLALERFGIARPFALAVGTLEPRKNLGRLLEAWRRAHLAGWGLVVAGPRGWGPALPATPGVRLLGWVGDDTLPGLLAAADLFCYPSLYEGFGLPPLEAMATGTPAMVGRYSAAAEVLGDAALMVDATDADSIAEGLSQLAADEALRRRLATAGRTRAAAFTWERTARATLDAYRAALDDGSVK